MVHIAIDGNEANHENRVGVNSYAYELLHSLHGLLSAAGDVSYTVFLKEPPLSHMPKEKQGWGYKVLPGGGLWVVRTLTPYLARYRTTFHVFWSPNHYTPPVPMVPLVCSVMDVGFLENSAQFTKKDFWQLKLWTAWSLIVSKKVLCISETTRKDLVKRYPFAHEKAITTLLGYDKKLYNTSVKKGSVYKNYILFMSTLKPSKNIEGLLHGWGEIFHEFPQTKLVIAGKKGWLFESIFKTVENLGLKDSVVFTDFVHEKDKPGLIAGAKTFVLPSFWEGFGLDVVSAMACAVPVIVSDRGSLPEVVGDAGIIVNPDDPHSIASALRTVLTLPEKEYNILVKRGIAQASKYSWENTAKKTLEALVSVARKQ